ncbi:hypothetical protein WJS89_05585 [Sphingomicrobium sp. XHP0235]|uniref:hypothetical protein n=1 Tax=Sphingomicrobium aquimarinum TaxID=3133971 RepID=UPI0031FE6F12
MNQPLLIATKVLLILAIEASLADRALAQDMNQLLERKYDILEKEAEANRLRAEAEARRAPQSANRVPPVAARMVSSPEIRHTVGQGSNDFANFNAPTYQLPNGVVLEVSGDLLPGADVVCLSNC